MTPEQLKHLGMGFLAYADERAGPLKRAAIASARAHLESVYPADLYSWFANHGYLPPGLQSDESEVK